MLTGIAKNIAKKAAALAQALQEYEDEYGDVPFYLGSRENLKASQYRHRNRVRKSHESTDVVPRLPPKMYSPLTPRTDEQNKKLFQVLSAVTSVNTAQQQGMTPDEVVLVIDSGASCTITNSLDDFVGPVHKVQNCTISGIASGLEIEAIGTVEYTLCDDKSNPFCIRIERTLYVPDCPVRLLCPQQLIDQTGGPDDGLHISGRQAILQYNGHTLTVPHDKINNLPIVVCEPGIKRFANFVCRECNVNGYKPNKSLAFDAETDALNLLGKGALEGGDDSLTANQRELLKQHRIHNHRDMKLLQEHARKDLLPKCILKVKPKDYPKCPDCQFGDSNRRPAQNRGKIDEADNAPGDCVSADQLEAGTPGLIPSIRGRKTNKRHGVATIYIGG